MLPVPTDPSLWGQGGLASLPGVSARPCSLCPDAGLIVKMQGNATHNTVCQCRAGMHCSDISCQTCVENQPCQLGSGFVAGKSDKLFPFNGTDALSALTSGNGGSPWRGTPWQGFGRAVLLPQGMLHTLPLHSLAPSGPHAPQPLLTFLPSLLLFSQSHEPDVIPL